jgi:mono/diheme cytochrome c family protein
VTAARGAALILAALLIGGCGQDEPPAPTSGASGAPTAAAPAPGDAARGRQVWLAQCVACHNADPAKDGTIGPAVKGASAALLQARVLHATYPPGYTPKRDTRVMPARPDLAPAIPDLTAFLR